MTPSSLLNVSPELIRERMRFGAADVGIDSAIDRAWVIGLGTALPLLAVLLFYVLF